MLAKDKEHELFLKLLPYLDSTIEYGHEPIGLCIALNRVIPYAMPEHLRLVHGAADAREAIQTALYEIRCLSSNCRVWLKYGGYWWHHAPQE